MLSPPRRMTATLLNLLPLLQFFLLHCSHQGAHAVVVNRTIDDHYGDSQTGLMPVYVPATGNVWKGEDCDDCTINVDVERTFRGTYTSATYSPIYTGEISITLRFEGVAIYVYFVLSNYVRFATTETDVFFVLDGGTPVPFSHIPDLGTTRTLYNYLVFSRSGLSADREHTLLITTAGVDHNTFVNFDYAIYTHDDGTTAQISPPPPPPISFSSSTPSTTLATTGSRVSTNEADSEVLEPSATEPSSTSFESRPAVSVISTQSNASMVAIPFPTTATDSTAGFDRGEGNGGSDTSDEHHGSAGEGSTSTSSPRTRTIVGAVLGSVALILAVILVLVVCMKRRRRDRDFREGKRVALGHGTSDDAAAEAKLKPTADFVDPFYVIAEPQWMTQSTSPPASPISSIPKGGSLTGAAARSPTSPASPLAFDQIVAAPTHSPGGVAVSGGPGVEAVRRARQEELDQQLARVEQDMTYLGRDIKQRQSFFAVTQPRTDEPIRRTDGGAACANSTNRDAVNVQSEGAQPGIEPDSSPSFSSSSFNPGDGNYIGNDIEEMRAQMRAMQRQIEVLRENRRSDWAAGLSDEPPPLYAALGTNQVDQHDGSALNAAGISRGEVGQADHVYTR